MSKSSTNDRVIFYRITSFATPVQPESWTALPHRGILLVEIAILLVSSTT